MSKWRAGENGGKPWGRVRPRSSRAPSPSLSTAPDDDHREFPCHPRVGVGGVVIENGQVLLVRRGREPLKGDWSIPGGLVEIGESLAEALWREVKEETGLEIEPLEVIGVFERILRGVRSSGRSNRVRYHYILIDYACRLDPGGRRRKRGGPGSNDPRAASDVSEARWVRREELAQYRLTPEAHDLILEAFRWLSETRWAK